MYVIGEMIHEKIVNKTIEVCLDRTNILRPR